MSDIVKTISNNRILLVSFIIYFIVLMGLIIFLLYIHSQKNKVEGKKLISGNRGKLGINT